MDFSYNSDDDDDDLSSDEELQNEFSGGSLKPGLIVRNPSVKTFTNNVSGMQEKLADMQRVPFEWLERMDVTTSTSHSEDTSGGGGDVDPEDDFKREMHFYQQAQSSVLTGLRKLEELSVPTERPEDYFAEMIKTDDHMRKIRKSLLGRQKVLEEKEKARKMRELKKYGKKVQHEILQKRRKEKKATLDAVKRYKRGKGERPSFLDRRGEEEEDHFPVTAESKPAQPGKSKQPQEKSKKRKIKDKKFGFGGKKRWIKSNTAESSADMSAFSAAKHSRKIVKHRGGGGGGRGTIKGGRGKGSGRGGGRGRGSGSKRRK